MLAPPTPLVNLLRSVPSEFIKKMSNVFPCWLANAIVFPSGDQAGEALYVPAYVNLLVSVPSLFIIKIVGFPLFDETQAI